MALALAGCGLLPIPEKAPAIVSENLAWEGFKQACADFRVEASAALSRLEAKPADEWDRAEAETVQLHNAEAKRICAEQDQPGLRTLQIKDRIRMVKEIAQ